MKGTKEFTKMKIESEPIVMVTAYDYPSAKQVEEAGADVILVGDSLGMVVLGYESTVPVTVADMIHHTKAVKRGAPDTYVVTDMPFMSYHASREDTMKNARRIIQESGANALKVEGGGEVISVIRTLTEAGVPIVAHLGLTPQSVGVLGGYGVQGKDAESARRLMEDARAAEAAGAVMLVLEAVPKQLSAAVTEALAIPVIGIGAGRDTDGQVLVYHDVITYGVERVPRFAKRYADVNTAIKNGISQFAAEVKNREFPGEEHSFTMKNEQLAALYGGQE
ncbi:3-methyl-2-oxobutanoate hydroxymethyltransferase [Bacillus marinisedimentorum]|uniref:3-methyl-2-oxobutanoate hydroxymethyltransferase n=1 Tax=Bacillus marinisedimentorum TaxID=1821260 RepID=UPI0008727E44|nr:3-methyl-2-oxobutanoate hydroxymethyltransferase [Bacillus marinisedimentorum]